MLPAIKQLFMHSAVRSSFPILTKSWSTSLSNKLFDGVRQGTLNVLKTGGKAKSIFKRGSGLSPNIYQKSVSDTISDFVGATTSTRINPYYYTNNISNALTRSLSDASANAMNMVKTSSIKSLKMVYHDPVTDHISKLRMSLGSLYFGKDMSLSINSGTTNFLHASESGMNSAKLIGKVDKAVIGIPGLNKTIRSRAVRSAMNRNNFIKNGLVPYID